MPCASPVNIKSHDGADAKHFPALKKIALHGLAPFVEQGFHVHGVKSAPAFQHEATGNIRDFQLAALRPRPTGPGLESQPLASLHGHRESATQNGQHLSLGHAEIGAQFPVHEYVELRDRQIGVAVGRHIEGAGQRTVHMQLMEAASLRMHINERRLEHAGNAAGGEQHLLEQRERLITTAPRYSAHVPHDRATGIQIGCDDEEAPSPVMSSRHIAQKIRSDGLVDQTAQGPCVHETFRRSGDLEHIGGGDGRIGGLKHGVIGRAQKCVDPEEGPGADAGD